MHHRVSSSRRSRAASLILFAMSFATAALLAAPALLAGPAGPAGAAGAAGPATPVAKAAPLVPVSLLDLMRASVEIPADGIWAAQGAEKLDEDDWLLVDEDSVSLAGAATLISKPGTGKNDRRDVQTTALAIRAAAKARDSAKFTAAADHLSEVCQSCHTKYRPEAPSDGVARYPFYPKRELAK
jgi:hypothetical protein